MIGKPSETFNVKNNSEGFLHNYSSEDFSPFFSSVRHISNIADGSLGSSTSSANGMAFFLKSSKLSVLSPSGNITVCRKEAL